MKESKLHKSVNYLYVFIVCILFINWVFFSFFKSRFVDLKK